MAEEDSEEDVKTPHAEILEPEEAGGDTFGLPSVPYPAAEGLGIFGFLWSTLSRLRSARVVIEAYDRTVQAHADAKRSLSDLNDANIEYQRSLRRVEKLDELLEQDDEQRASEKLRYAIEKQHLENQLAEAQDAHPERRREREKGEAQARKNDSRREFSAELDEILGRLVQKPIEINRRCDEAIQSIITNAGGEEHLTERNQAEIDEINEYRDALIRNVRTGVE